MKPSRYNHFVSLKNGTVLAYNCLTGALAEIEEENFPRISRLLKNSATEASDLDGELAEGLTEGGYLVADETDEAAELLSESLVRRQQRGILTLTIAPTLACNFACDYCFIDQANIKMDESTQQALLKFVDRKLDDIVRLRVSWFGGEPTLCFPTIVRLQSQLNEMAAARKIEMGPNSMVSNGYVLDREKASQLRDLGINKVQITLDGPEAIHDSRRKLRGGGGTFKRILKNLEEIVDILKIHVRINVDRDNLESAIEVIKILDRMNILPKITTSFAQVVSTNEVCASIADRCFCETEFSKCLTDLYQRLIDQGIYQVDYPKSFGAVLCGALTENCFAVTPTGHLFRCRDSLSADPEKAIGDIFGTPLTENQKYNLEQFRSWNPFTFRECRDCDILPICMGGCPLHLKDKSAPVKGTCSPWKYNLEKMLRLKYRCEVEKPAIRPISEMP